MHLVTLGVDHIDIRHANILEAPQGPPGWPSLASPFVSAAYRYRLVDFELARKTNRDLWIFEQYSKSWVDRLLNALPLGYVLETWDF